MLQIVHLTFFLFLFVSIHLIVYQIYHDHHMPVKMLIKNVPISFISQIIYLNQRINYYKVLEYFELIRQCITHTHKYAICIYIFIL